MMQKKYIIGGLLSVFILAVLLYNINLNQVVSTISKANLWFVAAAIVYTLVNLTAKVWRWASFLLAYKIKMKRFDVISSYLASLFLANVTPARLGEVSRPYFLKKKYKIPFMKTFPVVIVERFLDTIMLLGFSILFLIFFYSYIPSSTSFYLLILTVFLIFAMILLLKKSILLFLSNSFFSLFKAKKTKKKFNKAINDFYEGFTNLRLILNRKEYMSFVKIIGLTFVSWIAEFIIVLFSALALGVPPSLLLFVYCAGFFSIAVLLGIFSSLPGGVGPTEVILTSLFVSVGIDPALSLSITLLSRFLSYGLSMLISSVFFFHEART